MLEEDTCVGAALAAAGRLLASAVALLVGFGSGALAFVALVGATEEDGTSDAATLFGCSSTFCFFGGGSKVTDDDVTAAGATDCLAGAGFGVGGGRAVP